MATSKQTALHFATDDHVKKNGIFYVPHSLLVEEEDFNDRKDYGTAEEMSELMESIYSQGPRVPLRGVKKGDKYVVYVGHRRKRAGDMAKEKYGVDILFPMIMYPPGATKKDMILDTLLTNNGKDLNPLEKASAVDRLINEKMTVRAIAEALGGVSDTYVKNLQKLWKAPEKAKEMIRKGVVSATLVMAALRDKKIDFDQWLLDVEAEAAAAPKKEKKGKKAKVTAKSGGKKTRAASSLGELKRFRKEEAGEFESKAKQEYWEFICGVLDNSVSYSQIKEFFTGK